MLTISQLLALIAGEPVALWSDWLNAMMAGHRLPEIQGADTEARVTPQTQRSVAARSGAIAVIPVQGVITAKRTPWEAYGYATSVQTLVALTADAVRDPDVKAVIHAYNTPGGSTTGLSEAHADIMALRGKKPIIAQVDHLAASAGYWLASAADEIVTAPSGLTGSVGVYMMHANVGRMFESAGVDVEFIQAGRDKTFGNQFEPLTDESRAYFQGLVDHAYQQFTGNVAAGRGIDAAAVQGEQFGLGRVLTAEAAKKAGMVDAIRTMDQTLAAYGAPAPTGDRQRRALALNILELG
jgi:signal peptide peptidase SppA